MCQKLAMRIVIGLDIKLSIANMFCFLLHILILVPCVTELYVLIEKKTSNDDAIEINNNTVVLEETDHNDMTEILNKVFPNCGVKISTFLKSKKMCYSQEVQ